MGSLPIGVIPTFEILLYSLVILLFLVTGFLNVKDLKIVKQDKWTRQDSVALTLWVLFYGFLLNFLLTLLRVAIVRVSSCENVFRRLEHAHYWDMIRAFLLAFPTLRAAVHLCS